MLKTVFGVLVLLMLLSLAMPFSFGAPTKFPEYKAKKNHGSPPLPRLLSRHGAATPSSGLGASQNTPLLSSSLSAVCSFSSPFTVGGVVSGPGGQFFERWDTGDLWFFNSTSKTCSFIHHAPTGGACSPGSNCGYYGIASKGSFVALISWAREGLWTCTFSSATHSCTSVSSFIPLSLTFCNSMPTRFCNPDGMSFDSGSNLWYADIDNGVEVELTSASHYASVGFVIHFAAPITDVAIDPSTGTHWVVDYTCAGDLYKNGNLVSQAGDALGSVAISNLNPFHVTHVYVGVTADCGNYPYAFVGDQSQFIILPSPFVSANPIPGISTSLYFSDFFGHVWLTKDTA